MIVALVSKMVASSMVIVATSISSENKRKTLLLYGRLNKQRLKGLTNKGSYLHFSRDFYLQSVWLTAIQILAIVCSKDYLHVVITIKVTNFR